MHVCLYPTDIFNGTVMSSAGDTSMDIEVDVEEDDTATYGPAQYPVVMAIIIY